MLPVNFTTSNGLLQDVRFDSTTPMFIGNNDVYHFLQVTVTFGIVPESKFNSRITELLKSYLKNFGLLRIFL